LQDPVEPNLIFAGTEQGLWVSFDNGNSFEQLKNDYPSVSTYDLAIQEREADLAIATFGRSIYILDDIRPLRKMAALKGQLPPKQLTVFEAPVSYMMNIKNSGGINSSPWGIYDGRNRTRGAAYSFFVKPSLKTDTIKTTLPADTARGRTGLRPTGDTAVVRIYNENNELIRTLRQRADTGFNRVYWQYEMRGVRRIVDPNQTTAGGAGGGGRFGRFAGARGAEPASVCAGRLSCLPPAAGAGIAPVVHGGSPARADDVCGP
jgi:hypothetical protein